jgi:serine/threonine protein phosphatase PrpC
MIGNVKVAKKKKPRSQEKIQMFGGESGSSSNNHTKQQQQCSSSLNVNSGNKKQIHIYNKQKIIKTPISLYASSTINAHTHKRTVSSVSSNASSQKKHHHQQQQQHQHLNKASSLLSSSSNTKHPSNTTMNNISEHTHNTSSTSCSTPIKTIKNILTISKQGIDLQNLPKVNQDSFFVSTIQTTTKYKYIGVCDGHGPNGHFVSNFLKETLPKELTKHFQDKSFRLKHLPKLFEHTYLSSNSKLSNNANIDTNFSGSTAVSIVFPDNLYINPIYIANVGDSRAIVIKQNDNSCNSASWAYECLSRDHKPDERDEALRIIRFGGRIEQFKDREGKYVGPLRIWLSKENIPGLAMTRSFGDQLAATVGVVCEPEVKEYFVKEEDKCVVVASDGLWEYISNERCVNIAREYYANNVMKEELTEVLYREAKKKWKEYDINVDDITIVVIEL